MLTAPLIQGVGVALPALVTFLGVCTLAPAMGAHLRFPGPATLLTAGTPSAAPSARRSSPRRSTTGTGRRSAWPPSLDPAAATVVP